MEKGLARADHLMRAARCPRLASTLRKMLDWGFSAQAADQGVVRADATFGGMYRDGQVFRPLNACVASRTPRSMRRWSIRQYRVHRQA